MKIPDIYDNNAVLIADDEPEHIEWLADYFRAKGFHVTLVTNVAEAIAVTEAKRFRLYVIDLNIPLGDWMPRGVANETYQGYQGLHIIQWVRTQGNSGKRVIAYSAHYNDQITAAIKGLYCEYVVKGRAQQLKQVISEILASDPVIASVTRTRLGAPKAVSAARKRNTAPGAHPIKSTPIKPVRKSLSASPKRPRRKL